MSPARQSIVVMPTHPNAEVFVDGVPMGKGATTVQMSKRSGHTVMAKCGQSVGVAQVDRVISTHGFLDLVGGYAFYFPMLGIASPGFWELDPPTVAVVVPDSSACEKSVASPPSPIPPTAPASAPEKGEGETAIPND